MQHYYMNYTFFRELSPLAIDEIQHTDLMELVMLRLQEQIVGLRCHSFKSNQINTHEQLFQKLYLRKFLANRIQQQEVSKE